MAASQSYSRWRFALYGLLILFLFLWESAPGGMPAVFSVLPLPVLPAVVCIAMFEQEIIGAVFGGLGGALVDLASSNPPGFACTALLIIGCAAGLAVRLLMRATLLTSFVLSVAAALLYFTFSWMFFYLFRGLPSAGYAYVRFALPMALYTALCGPPLFLLLRAAERRLKK